VWYLFPRNRSVRAFIVVTYTACAVATIVKIKEQHALVRQVMDNIDLSGSPPSMWSTYLPSLIVHTAFFLLKVIRLSTATVPIYETFLSLFFQEGCAIYLFALASLLYTIISLSFTGPSDVAEFITALASDATVVAAVVSVCRAMLHIRSLADTWHVEQSWLLNHAELSRLNYTRELQGREIHVEIGAE